MRKSVRTILKGTAFFLVIGAVLGGLVFFKAQFTFSNMSVSGEASGQTKEEKASFYYPLPEDNSSKTNVLILGIKGTKRYGGLLTDTILLASLDEKAGEVSLVSIPRDLYVRMPGSDHNRKINYAYAYGLQQGGVSQGMQFARRTVSKVTGAHIDNTVVLEMSALKKVVDTLGGIDIQLERKFVEDKQWFCNDQGEDCWNFTLPKGENHLDGKTAVYYVRSRFSSSDFDRARRQQQVLLAVKDKLFSMNFLANPRKVYDLLEVVEKNVKFDFSRRRLAELIKKSRSLEWNLKSINRLVLKTGPDGVLQSTHKNGQYILLPKKGSWQKVRDHVQEFLTSN